MDLSVQTGSTKASSNVSLLAQTFTSREKERAFLLIQVEASLRDAKAMEEECASIVNSALLSTEGEPWHRLDGTLKEFNGLFKGLQMSHTVDDVHAVVALIDDENMLHVSHAGRGEAYLIRRGATSQITEFSRGKPVPMFIHISSGPIEEDDTVIFSTQRLLRSFTPAQLHQVVQQNSRFLDDIISSLESERDTAAVAAFHVKGASAFTTRREPVSYDKDDTPLPSASRRSSRGRSQEGFLGSAMNIATLATERVKSLISSSTKRSSSAPAPAASSSRRSKGSAASAAGSMAMTKLQDWLADARAFTRNILADLRHPQRKKRAHMILIAAAVAVFLVGWAGIQLSMNTQRGKTKTQLSDLMKQIDEELRVSENRRLTGDIESANAILTRAEEQAKQVINNESGFFRSEALNVLDRINSKKEEINNVTRVQPRTLVNLSSKNPDVSAQGLIGIADGEFVVYDRQQWYAVLLSEVEDGKKVSDQDLIVDGNQFARYQSQVFLTSGNSVIEVNDGVSTDMKTDDPNGWVTGKDVKTYLRFLYVLTTDDKILKYERLNNRYGPGVQYNINGDLKNAVDLAIDGNVFVLKSDGTIVKLLRGEVQPFAIKRAPAGMLKDATKIFKMPDGNFYALDPVRKRVIVFSDGGSAGDSAYIKQYALEGEQISKLQDLYVDPDESHLYVLDEKRVYVVDIVK